MPGCRNSEEFSESTLYRICPDFTSSHLHAHVTHYATHANAASAPRRRGDTPRLGFAFLGRRGLAHRHQHLRLPQTVSRLARAKR